MFTVKLAGMCVEFDNRYGHLYEYCRDWLTQEAPLFRVKVYPDETETYMKNCGMPVSEAVAERILAYRKACAGLTEYGVFLLHGALISYRGQGVLFIAGRGVGKTTHIRLWKECFGNEVLFINGDKPLVKKLGDKYVGYGTPWRGKEGLGDNLCAPIDSVCFLDRAEKASVCKISAKDAASLVSKQTVYPARTEQYDIFSENIADFLKSTRLFYARVNMNVNSAISVRDYLFGK